MNKLLYLLLLFALPVLSQDRQALQGKVMADDATLAGVFVINKQTGTEVKTDAQGLFTIAAKAGDKLVVYSDKVNVREFLLGQVSFASAPYVLAVEMRSFDIEEVVVNKQAITSEGLGLVPVGQKRLTVAERRLAAADSGPVDILINWLTGRKKMLERELVTERKEMAMDNLNGILNEDELAAEYHIPAEQIPAFLFYVIDDKRVTDALAAGNEHLVQLLLLELGPKFLTLQTEAAPTTETQTTPVQTNDEN